MTIRQQVYDMLVEDPFLPAKDMAEKLDVRHDVIHSCIRISWDINLMSLRKQILNRHWQRKPKYNPRSAPRKKSTQSKKETS